MENPEAIDQTGHEYTRPDDEACSIHKLPPPKEDDSADKEVIGLAAC